jgi:hypothetical protein
VRDDRLDQSADTNSKSTTSVSEDVRSGSDAVPNEPKDPGQEAVSGNSEGAVNVVSQISMMQEQIQALAVSVTEMRSAMNTMLSGKVQGSAGGMDAMSQLFKLITAPSEKAPQEDELGKLGKALLLKRMQRIMEE